MTQNLEDKLIEQISIAMKDTPGMCLVDLLTRVMQVKYPTRSIPAADWYMKTPPVKWKMTNQSLLVALEYYNRMREHDKRTVSRTTT